MLSYLKTVYQAIKAGYRLLDGAADYGNEKEAGEGVHRALKEGIAKREELCELPNYSDDLVRSNRDREVITSKVI